MTLQAIHLLAFATLCVLVIVLAAFQMQAIQAALVRIGRHDSYNWRDLAKDTSCVVTMAILILICWLGRSQLEMAVAFGSKLFFEGIRITRESGSMAKLQSESLRQGEEC